MPGLQHIGRRFRRHRQRTTNTTIAVKRTTTTSTDFHLLHQFRINKNKSRAVTTGGVVVLPDAIQEVCYLIAIGTTNADTRENRAFTRRHIDVGDIEQRITDRFRLFPFQRFAVYDLNGRWRFIQSFRGSRGRHNDRNIRNNNLFSLSGGR